MSPKAFVSGCFDLLHSGHMAFFQAAAKHGDLYVAIGSDRTIFELKGRPPLNTEAERLYMIRGLACVKEAFISKGSGTLDFAAELREIHPDYFILNEDGSTPEKRQLCDELGIQYVILKREPHADLPARSTTALRGISQVPYRIDLAGGWLDQPFVSTHYPGPVLTVSIHPTIEFNQRSGMATSTRSAAVQIWGSRLPADNPEKLAKILFAYDNPPGTKEISGSQDAIGIVFPGLARADYAGEYWPTQITSVQDEPVLRFIEESIHLIPLNPRPSAFSVLSDTQISEAGARALSAAANACWEAILARDTVGFGRSVRDSFEAQVAMFPHMLTDSMLEQIEVYRDRTLGWKVSGAGGGGYLIFVADHNVEHSIHVNIRRASD